MERKKSFKDRVAGIVRSRKARMLALVLLFLAVGAIVLAQDVTITTYYPAPYGVYNELQAKIYKDLDDPDNYYLDLDQDWSWVYKLNVGPDMKSLNKVGAPYDKALLHVGGGSEKYTSIYGGTDQSNWIGVFGYNAAGTGAESYGVCGQTNSTDSTAAGVYGEALGTSGATYGVIGTNQSSSDSAVGVYGQAVGASGITFGVEGLSNSTSDYAAGVYGIANRTSGATSGVKGVTNSTSNYASGVYGYAGGTSGVLYGVRGWSDSATNDSAGVYGYAGNNGGAVYGVRGWTSSNADYTAGVYGYASGTTAVTIGVRGQVESSQGFSGYFVGGRGIRVQGRVYVTIDDPACTRGVCAGDLAEDIRADGCKAGDVVVIDPDNDRGVVRSDKAYSSSLAGVISEDPVFHIGQREGWKPLALCGQLRCKATTENGPIKRGDILVTSSKLGYAMKADIDKVKPGMIVGKALEELKDKEGKILILVSSY